jgi:hypothetical protein
LRVAGWKSRFLGREWGWLGLFGNTRLRVGRRGVWAGWKLDDCGARGTAIGPPFLDNGYINRLLTESQEGKKGKKTGRILEATVEPSRLCCQVKPVVVFAWEKNAVG